MSAWEGQLAEEEIDYYSEDERSCEWCDESNHCWCQEALNCTCGGYFFGNDGRSHTFGDCYCGA
jgi:hypothetical protein